MLRTAALALVGVVALARGGWAQDEPAPAPPPETEAPSEAAPEAGAEAAPAPSPEAAPEPSVSPEASAVPPQDGTSAPEVTVKADSAPADADAGPGFAFGSYGRVSFGSDLRGGSPERIAVVAHPPRIVEPSYVETDLYYRFLTKRGVRVRTVTTLAFDDTLFHYTGQFDAHPALRNLYLEARHPAGFTVWAGSRMYRGDDIYLFDYWPLDDVNTLGAGASLTRGRVDVALHAGTNRLLDPFQFQQKDVAAPEQGATRIEVLDRQRFIATLIGTVKLDVARIHTKAKLYLEAQRLPAGQRRRADDSIEELGADSGYSIGAQLGAWGFGARSSHANLFARLSTGLAAYDELFAPAQLDQDLTTSGASELVLGAGAAYEIGRATVIGAAYARRFEDPDASTRDRDDGWEYAADVRPEVALMADVKAGFDLSYQARFPRGVSPVTLLAADPAVFQLAPMLIYAPIGGAAFDRPQLRLVYRAAHLNDAARDLYATADPRREHAWVHFLGVQAEWWFNSSTR